MTEEQIKSLKTNIIAIGRLLWEKDLVSGLNGNISARTDEDTLLITAHGTCLGLLQDKDIVLANLSGEPLEKGKRMSTEKLLHTEIYKNFPDITAVIHTHTTYTNGYFMANDILEPSIFEAKFYLGKVRAVPQYTPAVTDAGPVIEALKTNNIVVLKNHGVVAMGKDLFQCFLLIQGLEDAVTVDAVSRLYQSEAKQKTPIAAVKSKKGNGKAGKQLSKRFKLFSKEQIAEIVQLVNKDARMKEMGTKTNMTMDLAVKLNETGQVYSFSFQKGRIAKVGNDANAEFVISAPEKIWRAVFNREIDPFVATTQKKMDLKGDFARISKWYAPCSRIFEIWANVPVE